MHRSESQYNRIQQPSSYIPSMCLSFIPVATIAILYFILNQIFPISGYNFLYNLIICSLFVVANILGYSILASLVQFSVYWRASLLANVFLVGCMSASQTTTLTLQPFGFYLMSLSFFHMSEFLFTALYNHKDVSTDSFLLNHSLEYGIAALASWFEYTIEAFFVPQLKLFRLTFYTGLLLVVFGELFRKLAMYTAGRSFNHYVQEERQSDHVLVTNGVYRLVRHPSYFGWFIWSVGTQILLANPICVVVYAIASWKFFKSRITYEEFHLIKFFGKQYTDYQRRVPSGVPFVKGFLLVDETLD
jgi:protein-S-isoprenylcysteine O-methyltransferase